MPEGQQRIHLIAAQGLAEQRRRGVLNSRLSGQIDSALGRGMLQQQPTQPVRPAGDADAFAAQVVEGADGAAFGHQHFADLRGKRQVAVGRAGLVTRLRPEQIAHRAVNAATGQCQPRGRHIGHQPHLQLEAVGAVQSLTLEMLELPVRRAELQHAEGQHRQLLRLRPQGQQHKRQQRTASAQNERGEEGQ